MIKTVNKKSNAKTLSKIRNQELPVEQAGFCREHRYGIPRGFMYIAPRLVYPQRAFNG
jgi:hypothetical protein